MKRNDTNYTLEMADGRKMMIGQATVRELLQWLDEIPDWTPDEVEAVMTEACDRLGMDVEDFEYCDDCFDKLMEAYNEWERDTDVEKLKAHIYGGLNVIGPEVTFKVVRQAPETAELVDLDPETFTATPNAERLNYFDFYRTTTGYVAVRRDL